jgi:diamine N-acetyltransferase
MAELTLQPATIADIPTIAGLASQIWRAHYVPIIGEKQVEYMLQTMYNAESLRTQMQEKKDLFYLLKEKEVLCGFISLHEEAPGNWFLNKFYILSERAGKGLGTRVLDKIIQQHTIQKLTLTVNRQNYKSINFYFKNGFVIREVADFAIGGGYEMNDFVMERGR